MPLVYGGLDRHTIFRTQKRIYIISKRKSYNTPKLGQTKNECLDESRWIEAQLRQVGTIPQIMHMDKRELWYLQEVRVELKGREWMKMSRISSIYRPRGACWTTLWLVIGIGTLELSQLCLGLLGTTWIYPNPVRDCLGAPPTQGEFPFSLGLCPIGTT